MSISVCIAVYNGSLFIEKSLQSILSQLKTDDEIIIVDDASTDNSIELIKKMNDKRIKLYSNESNKGVNYSFFKALKIAQGDLIFIADQDDLWKKEKVSSIKSIMEEQKIELIIHDGEIIEKGNKIKKSIFDTNKSGKGLLKNIWSDTYVGCCMVMSRDTKNKLLPHNINKDVFYDHYLGLMAEIKKISILFYSEKLIEYNRHSNTITDINKRRGLLAIIKDRIRLIKMLISNMGSR